MSEMSQEEKVKTLCSSNQLGNKVSNERDGKSFEREKWYFRVKEASQLPHFHNNSNKTFNLTLKDTVKKFIRGPHTSATHPYFREFRRKHQARTMEN